MVQVKGSFRKGTCGQKGKVPVIKCSAYWGFLSDFFVEACSFVEILSLYDDAYAQKRGYEAASDFLVDMFQNKSS
jgi:hypothetical protein